MLYPDIRQLGPFPTRTLKVIRMAIVIKSVGELVVGKEWASIAVILGAGYEQHLYPARDEMTERIIEALSEGKCCILADNPHLDPETHQYRLSTVYSDGSIGSVNGWLENQVHRSVLVAFSTSC